MLFKEKRVKQIIQHHRVMHQRKLSISVMNVSLWLPGHKALSDTERLSMNGYDTLVTNVTTLLLSLVISRNTKKLSTKV